MDLENKLNTVKIEKNKLLKLIEKAENVNIKDTDLEEIDRVLFFTLIMYGVCDSDLYYKHKRLNITKTDLEMMNAFYFVYNKAKHEAVFKAEEKDLGYGSIVDHAEVGKAELGKKYGIVWADLKNDCPNQKDKYKAYVKLLKGKKISDTINMEYDLITCYYPKLIELCDNN